MEKVLKNSNVVYQTICFYTFFIVSIMYTLLCYQLTLYKNYQMLFLCESLSCSGVTIQYSFMFRVSSSNIRQLVLLLHLCILMVPNLYISIILFWLSEMIENSFVQSFVFKQNICACVLWKNVCKKPILLTSYFLQCFGFFGCKGGPVTWTASVVDYKMLGVC